MELHGVQKRGGCRGARVRLELRQWIRGRVGSEVRGAGRQARRWIRADREGRVGHHAPLNVGDAPFGASLVLVEVKVGWGGVGIVKFGGRGQ